MSYKHILVAVDFAKENRFIVEKAVKLARALGSKVSLIHLDEHISDEADFGGLIDTELAGIVPAYPTTEELRKKLDVLVAGIDYPFEHKILTKGNIAHGLEDSVVNDEVDLIVCGHHHNFWSRLKPSSRDLLNTALVDLLVVPLKG